MGDGGDPLERIENAKRYQDEVRNVGLEMLPDGSYRGSPTDVGGPTPPTDVGGPTPPTDSGQMTAAAVVLAVLPLLAV